MFRRSFLVLGVLAALSYPVAHTQTAVEDRYFSSDGVRIRYIDVGRGEPIVLVHGFSSSLDSNWMRSGMIEKLSKDFRVIAFDCRGHGKSDKPHEPSSYGNKMVEDVARPEFAAAVQEFILTHRSTTGR